MLSANPLNLSVLVVVAPGGTNVCARESPADNINLSSPRSAAKRFNVVPDRELRQDSVSLPLEQDFSWVRFNLDSTDAGMSAKESAEDSTSCSCEQVEFSEGIR